MRVSQAVYDDPADAFVFDFLGGAVRLPGRVEGGQLTVGDWSGAAPAGAPQGVAQVFFCQDQASLGGPDGEGFSAVVAGLVRRRPAVRVDLEALGQPIELLLSPGEVPDLIRPGCSVRVAPRGMRVFSAP